MKKKQPSVFMIDMDIFGVKQIVALEMNLNRMVGEKKKLCVHLAFVLSNF